MSDDVLTIGATEFKAKCLAIFDQLEGRKLSRVIVTRRGKTVAELVPPGERPPSLWGAHPGSAIAAPGIDLTEPAFDEPFDAQAGILCNE